MSEYQYYEFVAVDRQLTRDEMAQLRSISTRATVSSTHFCNTYNYGDLKAEPEQMLRDYFDAFVYDSNFAYRRFMIKLPKVCFDKDNLALYFPGDNSCYRAGRDHWLIEFCYSNDEGYDDEWNDGDSEGWMGSLVSIRSELMRGDYRSLYLVWLAAIEDDDVAEGTEGIPVPAGLGDLTASQSALCDFLRLEPYLVKAAANHSPALQGIDVERCVSNWLNDLPLADCKTLLKVLLLDESGSKRAEQVASLLKNADDNPQVFTNQTTAALKEQAGQLRIEGERKAKEARRKKLDNHIADIATKESAYWQRVNELFEMRGCSSVYQELAGKLSDLHLVAARDDKVSDYKKRIAALQSRYGKKQSHWRALQIAAL